MIRDFLRTRIDISLEFKPADFWIGLYFKREGWWLDVYVCIVPMLPIHIRLG